jgi:hypothetical protein
MGIRGLRERLALWSQMATDWFRVRLGLGFLARCRLEFRSVLLDLWNGLAGWLRDRSVAANLWGCFRAQVVLGCFQLEERCLESLGGWMALCLLAIRLMSRVGCSARWGAEGCLVWYFQGACQRGATTAVLER